MWRRVVTTDNASCRVDDGTDYRNVVEKRNWPGRRVGLLVVR
jgi:hypothetical protein